MKNRHSETKNTLKLQYLQIQLFSRKKKTNAFLKVIEIQSTSHESVLKDNENELLFSDSEGEFEEDVAGSSSGLPNNVNF